jgi:hypothetical protein
MGDPQTSACPLAVGTVFLTFPAPGQPLIHSNEVLCIRVGKYGFPRAQVNRHEVEPIANGRGSLQASIAMSPGNEIGPGG